jgi:hypothetical protein
VQREWEDDGARCLEFQDGINLVAILNEGKVVTKEVNFMEKARFLGHFTILEYGQSNTVGTQDTMTEEDQLMCQMHLFAHKSGS